MFVTYPDNARRHVIYDPTGRAMFTVGNSAAASRIVSRLNSTAHGSPG